MNIHLQQCRRFTDFVFDYNDTERITVTFAGNYEGTVTISISENGQVRSVSPEVCGRWGKPSQARAERILRRFLKLSGHTVV